MAKIYQGVGKEQAPSQAGNLIFSPVTLEEHHKYPALIIGIGRTRFGKLYVELFMKDGKKSFRRTATFSGQRTDPEAPWFAFLDAAKCPTTPAGEYDASKLIGQEISVTWQKFIPRGTRVLWMLDEVEPASNGLKAEWQPLSGEPKKAARVNK